jgi:hypothetical protein
MSTNPFDRGPNTPAPTNTPAPAAPAANGFGGGVASPTTDDPYSAAAPVGLSDIKMKDPRVLNQLLMVEPIEYNASINTANGQTDAWRVNIIPLTGPAAGQLLQSVTVWQEALKRELSEAHAGPSRWLLAYHHEGNAKQGQSAPHLFTPANEEQKAIYRQFVEAQKAKANG